MLYTVKKEEKQPMSVYNQPRNQASHGPILVVLGTLFFMWGLITVLNMMLIEELKDIFAMTPTEALLVNFIFFATYFVAAIPAGKIISRYTFKNGIISGIVVAGFGCMLFYPAAENRSFSMFIIALLLLGAGITMLQVAANAYVVLVGRRERGASRLTMVQAFNSLGTLLAPLFASGLFMKIAGLEEGSRLAMGPEEYMNATVKYVQLPYLGLGAILFLLALFIGFSKLPRLRTEYKEPIAQPVLGKEPKYIFQFPHVFLGGLAIFCYVGAEVTIARYISFLAENMIQFYWGSAMVGRFLGAALLTQISPRKLISYSATGSAALTAIFTVLYLGGNLDSAVYALVAVGLFNSVLFPCIFTVGIDGLGKFSVEGSSVLIMSIVGGAIVPIIWGMFYDISLWFAFLVPVACYLYIAYYGNWGSRYSKTTNFY